MGDYVYVRLRPRRQASVVGPYIDKLQKRFFGPFKVTNKLGAITYELELPPSARIHNFFTLASNAHTKALFPIHHSNFLPKLTSISPYWNPGIILPPTLKYRSSYSGWDYPLRKQLGSLGMIYKDHWPITLIPSNESTTVASSQLGHFTDSKAVIGRTSKRHPQGPQHFKDYVATLPHTREKGKFLFGLFRSSWIPAMSVSRINFSTPSTTAVLQQQISGLGGGNKGDDRDVAAAVKERRTAGSTLIGGLRVGIDGKDAAIKDGETFSGSLGLVHGSATILDDYGFSAKFLDEGEQFKEHVDSVKPSWQHCKWHSGGIGEGKGKRGY
ncbi:hypothetical protein V8G54_009773 [Vigna mungo]|uniref:Tf2-1-like SH3-like domain-containing protein n=1 Tax=Vigna mungo TaxID=3915 RepID=A0AAQ3NXC4_VIGMU